MIRQLEFLPDAEAAWQSDAKVLVIAGAPADLPVAMAAVDDRLGCNASRLMARREPSEAPGSVTIVDVDNEAFHRVAWLPVDDGLQAARAAGAALARSVSADATLLLTGQVADVDQLGPVELAALCQAWELAGYRFTLKTLPPKPGGSLRVVGDPAAVAASSSLTTAAVTARDLANAPSNTKSPEWLAEEVRRSCREVGLVVTVRDADYLEAAGFGGILAVGRGSRRPPRLVEVKSRGRRGGPRVVLVGKGVTYDSGGLSLKPVDSMALMKTDMAGAAAVAGAMVAYGQDPGRNADAEVIALLPMAENMPDGSAYRPGDVIRHFGGITTEVSNTDAEGRLLLADALSYARERLAPDVVVDIATLTGAATLGLSRHYAALFTDDPRLADQLLAAGEASGDQVWSMPLVQSYRRYLESPIADIAQASTDAEVRAGAVMAALYLQRFVGDLSWAHIDMAGPGRAEKERGEHPVGATGYGARLLAQWLRTADFRPGQVPPE